MKKTVVAFPILLVLALALVTACRSEKKSDQEGTEQKITVKQVEPLSVFENDFVEVVSVSLEPGEELASHEGEMRLIYSLSDYSIAWEEKGEDLGTKPWKHGDVHVHSAGQHWAKNTGDARAEWIAFVRKTSELPTCEDLSLEKDVNLVAGEAATMIYEDDNFRLTEINLGPGESLPMHDGINRVVYAMSDYTISYWSDETNSEEKHFQKGEAHWHEGCQHSIQNTGDSGARFLVIAFK
jgi:hypothetical protein